MTESLFTPCACCGGPYHPATGGLHWVEFSQKFVAWCGPCERDFVKWVAQHSRSRLRRTKVDGKTLVLRFYDHAFPLDRPPQV